MAQIAASAGLTKRTFFRYFSDKREVLFGGSEGLAELFADSVRGAPAAAAPLEAVEVALYAVADLFEERREFATRRRRIIAASPELQERELIKLASLGGVVADALRARGVAGTTADLVAEAGNAVFRISFERWSSDPGSDLRGVFAESLAQLREVAA